MYSPKRIREEIILPTEVADFVEDARAEIGDIVHGRNKRFLLVVGPCSIHDADSAFRYAERLKELREKVPQFLLVMRTYFEKPRTTVGWTGFITDPYLDGSFDIEEGIREARKILIDINALGVPCGTEFLSPFIAPFIADLISWGAIGARTTESQIHRQLASSLPMPIGFKNSTNGDIGVAVSAIKAAQSSHTFLGIGESGSLEKVQTMGNQDAHLILRGGKIPNYSPEDIEHVQEYNLDTGIIIDCSHGNSRKDYTKQRDVCESSVDQRASGNTSIVGVSIEGHHLAGKQPIDVVPLNPDISVTDACIGFEELEEMVVSSHEKFA